MPATRSRSTGRRWRNGLGKPGFELEPLADYALARIKQGERIFADETTLPTLTGIGQGQGSLFVDLCPRRPAVSGAADRPSSPTASRTVTPANTSPAIWKAIAAL